VLIGLAAMANPDGWDVYGGTFFTPALEPATLAFVGMGSLLVIACRRRAARNWARTDQ
jgi:hypothetical protein